MEFRAGIIAAGLGERFQRAGVETPKPLLRVGGKTLLERAIENAAEVGASSIALIVNAERAELARYARSRAWPVPVALVVRTTPNSMESFFALEPALAGAAILLLTVDAIFAPAALRGLVSAGEGGANVLGVTRFVHDEKPLRVALDEIGVVTAIGPAAAASPWITSGVYFFAPGIHRFVPEARERGCARLRELLALLVERGVRMRGFDTGESIDVDDPEDLALAERFVAGSDS
ncbi:MAG: NTP transferase domain-containing protein [Candidatus Binatia bacterium]